MSWWAEAVRPRLLLLGGLRTAGPGPVTALLGVNLTLGVLPVAFVVASSVLVGRVPAAVDAGPGSPASAGLFWAFGTAAALFLAQQALAPVQVALGELVRLRVDGAVHDRVIATALGGTGIARMEDPAALDALADAARRLESNWETPGMGCAGLLALVARYVRLAGFAALVGVVVGWLPAVLLAVTTLLFRYGQRGGLRKYSQVWVKVTPLIRRGRYLRGLVLGPGAAKELRVYGLGGWLAERYERSYRRWLAPVWQARRRVYLWPYLGYTTIGLVTAVWVFTTVADAGTGRLTLTELALALQATVAALLLGEYYPEADSPTQFGMLVAGAVSRFERRMRPTDGPIARHPAPARDGPVEPGRDAAVGHDVRDAAVGPDPDPAVEPAHDSSREPARGSSRDPAGLPEPVVRFEHVTFRYPGADHDVLADLDLTLPAGRCTALVGLNGAGKTTLVKLLTRLHEPTAGTVRFGGADLRDFDVTAWRRQISVVFQDFVRYELSIADNVAFGAVHAPRDPDRIRRALHRADLADLLDGLPAGLDTPLSRSYPDGVDLSGGQWQRVAIARALYGVDHGARLLVLDEPTAALDVRAEAAFFARFVELTRGVTSLLISHRFSSVRHADHIVVLADGRVVEEGDHDALVAAGGRYAELFHLQAELFADEPGVTIPDGGDR
ncbi:ATP-binding cassette domain-containing protein [Micromonospora sp. WMMD1102]|uniref:ABC transporter ATP-binding protein n=1 Tax=Micromonospora sp. WMMD1102 TaxID=3016105 RepID=UPI002415425E|nr:ATP-binding cassette domain-containing protein [Micromonospora sp. WMMD1102]MDG4786775.1 ATP-binding cassette domain-containing protein [Micromonospora sp. WMMD1102]